MNADYSRTAVQKWDDDSKSWWSQRSGLEQKLIILLTIIGVLSSGFLTYYFITRKATPKICSTPDCLLAASEVISHVDPDIDPCEDFFKFACGNFAKQPHLDAKAKSIRGISKLVGLQMTDIIQEPIADEDHPLVKKQKQLFQACMNESAIEEESLDVFMETVKELKGWPVVVGYKWKARLFDWQDMVYELRARGYEHSMIMDVHITNDPADLNQYIPEIVQPRVESIREEHKELYKKYMVDVVVSFGAERNLAAIEMEQVLDFMERLNHIAVKNNPWQAENFNETSYNWIEDKLSRRFTVEEFQENHDEIDWLEFINTIISPAASITAEEYVIFPKNEYLAEFFYVLYKTPKRIQANYILWSVLQSIMPSMSKELKQLKGNYTCATDTSSPTKDRIDLCIEGVHGSFLGSPAAVLYARKYLSAEKKMEIEAIFENIKSELKTSLMEADWIDDESKDNTAEKIDALKGIVGYEEDYFNDTIFGTWETVDDETENDENDGFLNMLLAQRKRLLDKMYSLIRIPVNESFIYEQLMFDLSAVLYLKENNVLVIKPGILQGIYYNKDRLTFLNYGAIGAEIGQRLVQGFDEAGSKYDKDGAENDLWTNDTQKAFEERLKCFAEKVETSDFEYVQGKISIGDLLTTSIGLKVTYSAYKSWVEENEEEPQLPGVDYTPYQIFWISAMSSHCYTPKEEESPSWYMDEHAIFRAGIPMSNNFDFADDFNCPVDTRMNPSEKCEIF